MKQTISLALVAGASTVVVAAALSLPRAHAQAPSARSATAAPPASAPAAAPASQPPVQKAPYPPAVPVRAAPAQPVAPSPAAGKAAPASAAPVAAPAPSGPATGPAKAPATASAPPAPAPAPAPVPAALAPPAAPALPTPAEELVAFFKGAEGTWRCDGKMPAGAAGPDSRETPYKSIVKLKRELGGFWMAGEYEIKKSKLTPGAQARFFIGYEPQKKQFVSASFDSFGGMDRGESPGVQGNSLALTGTGSINGTKVQTRSTLTFTTPGKDLAYKFELDRGQGFQLVGEDSCKKGVAAPLVPGAPPSAGAADASKPVLAPKPVK